MIRRIFKFAGLALLALLPSRDASRHSGPTASPANKPNWKKLAFRTALVLAILGLGGFLVLVSGIVPIKASSGHWAITRWFLNFAKERSVATHSFQIKPPELDVEWRILKGAGHFEMGCRPCHGSPGTAMPRIPHAMTPHPPPLASSVAEWDAAGLFYIIKHGIKFTGMPAWPAKGRDDEVWDVVAFLRKLPELDAASYRRMVEGDAAASRGAPVEDLLPPAEIRDIVTESCARCHGADGLGRGTGAFPKLAGQKPEYLFASLKAFRSGERHSGIMQPLASALRDDEMRQIASYYHQLGSRTITNRASNVDEAAAKRGEKIALNGIPQKRVPACAACHGPKPTRRNPIYPLLSGQYPEYLHLQLELFHKKQRGGSDFHHLMHFVAPHLSQEEMWDVASYYASLPGQEVEQE